MRSPTSSATTSFATRTSRRPASSRSDARRNAVTPSAMRGERSRRAVAAIALTVAATMAAPLLLRARGQQPVPAAIGVEIAWHVPDADALPPGPWKDTVMYGRRLFTETPSLIGPEV